MAKAYDGLYNAAPLEILSAAHHTGYLILVPKGYLFVKPFLALHQITHVRVAHSEKMLHITALSCEVCRAVHRFANLSVTVHFIVECWFEF